MWLPNIKPVILITAVSSNYWFEIKLKGYLVNIVHYSIWYTFSKYTKKVHNFGKDIMYTNPITINGIYTCHDFRSCSLFCIKQRHWVLGLWWHYFMSSHRQPKFLFFNAFIKTEKSAHPESMRSWNTLSWSSILCEWPWY